MNNSYEKLLPLGTIVKLDERLKKVMIIGFCMQTKKNPGKIYDYIGCIYPNGLIITTDFFTFNHEDIKEICVLGYSNQEDKDFKIFLSNKMKEVVE